MFTKLLVVLSFIAAALTEPIPQGSAAVTTSIPAFPTSSFALPSSLAFLEACASSEQSVYSGVPTMPASLQSALTTVVPASVLTQTGCGLETALQGYYASLPTGIAVALSSYDSQVLSWYSAHSSQIAAIAKSCAVSGTATYTPTYTSVPSNVPVCSGGSLLPGSSATGTANAKTTAGSSAGTTATGTATGTAGASSTATGSAGSAASTTKSAGGAAPTGAVTFGAAGVVGILGLLVAL